MCGFLTSIHTQTPWSRLRFDQARDMMTHRGPDGAGSAFRQGDLVALGHRRLAILDLTSAGAQPMQRGTLWVVFNGEIYNFPALRQELEQQGCVFTSRTDTEVLLHGYRVWGDRLPNHLVGMFAFCIWDEDSRTLFAARDHAGQKPFYYYYDHKQFIAASEPKAIFSLLGGRPRMRREAMKEFLIYDDIPDPHTWYHGLQSLQPGHKLKLSAGSLLGEPAVSEYWSFRPPERPVRLNSRAAREQLGNLLTRSVKMHLLADVEVGAFLSGGLDSSGVVALASGARPEPVKTYSIGYKGDVGELPLAGQVAKLWGCAHHESLISEGGMAAAFERSLDVFDMPFGDSSQFPTYAVAAFAARDVKVVLTGDGGDEVFGGYWSLGRFMGNPPLAADNLFAFLSWLKHWTERKRAWQGSYNFGHCTADNAAADRMLGPEFKDLQAYDGWWFYKQHWLPELDPFRRAQWSDFKCYLPTVLKKVDRCTMQHSLEARCPLLLPELIEFMFSLPTPIKNPKGEFKYLYREWLRRSNLVPASLLNAPKSGFGISSIVANEFRASERLWACVNTARRNGWISSAGYVAAQREWTCAWRMALIGAALERGVLRE